MKPLDDERKRKKIIEYKDLVASYKMVFDTDVGKKVLKDLSKKGYFESTTFELGLNEMDISFREGRRSMYLYISQMVNKKLD